VKIFISHGLTSRKSEINFQYIFAFQDNTFFAKSTAKLKKVRDYPLNVNEYRKISQPLQILDGMGG
jgi:hypothetical protein